MNEVTLTQEEVKRMVASLELAHQCIKEQVAEKDKLLLQNSELTKRSAVYSEILDKHNADMVELKRLKNEAEEANSQLRAMLNEIRARAYNDNSDLGAWVIHHVETVWAEKPKDVCGVGFPYGQSGVADFCTKPYPCPDHTEKRKERPQYEDPNSPGYENYNDLGAETDKD